jgi:predicted nuclease with RNAse H fold
MRYCGIDVSAKAANQQLCTLHERRSRSGLELVATFYEPGTPEQIARTIQGFGRGEAVVAVDAPSAHRLDLLRPGSEVRAALALPEGRYERMRVCDAMLFRRGLPLYPVPSADEPEQAWQRWMQVGFEVFEELRGLGLFRPAGGYEGALEPGATASGRLCETYPDAIFCTLLGHRPGAKRTPSGLQERIAALKLKGIVDEDGGLWRRTLDELDACAAAYAAYGLAAGIGCWVGHPAEGVIVLPVLSLLDRYEKLPAPARAALA